MGLLCALGLATCVTIGGTTYPKEDAYDIAYECAMARSAGYYNDVTFILVNGKYRSGLQQGYLALDILEEHGVEFLWKPKGSRPGQRPNQGYLAMFRKEQLKLACYPFLAFSGG